MPHTPGPWKVMAYKHSPDHAIRCAANDNLALVRRQDMVESTSEANARLIASAPDLLAALVRARGELIYAAEKLPWSNAREALQIVDTAIARATGE